MDSTISSAGLKDGREMADAKYGFGGTLHERLVRLSFYPHAILQLSSDQEDVVSRPKEQLIAQVVNVVSSEDSFSYNDSVPT